MGSSPHVFSVGWCLSTCKKKTGQQLKQQSPPGQEENETYKGIDPVSAVTFKLGRLQFGKEVR